MSDWSSQPDEGGEGEAMGVTERIGAFCVCIFLLAALAMGYVTLANITIPMP